MSGPRSFAVGRTSEAGRHPHRSLVDTHRVHTHTHTRIRIRIRIHGRGLTSLPSAVLAPNLILIDLAAGPRPQASEPVRRLSTDHQSDRPLTCCQCRVVNLPVESESINSQGGPCG